MIEKLTDWEKEYISQNLVNGEDKSDFYYDNPSAAIDDIEFLKGIIKKLIVYNQQLISIGLKYEEEKEASDYYKNIKPGNIPPPNF